MTTSGPPFDLAKFEQDAASLADRISEIWTGSADLTAPRLGVARAEDKDRAIERVIDRVYQDATAAPGAPLGSKADVRAAALEARAALQNPSVRRTVCRALGPLKGKTANQLTVEIVKVCLPLALTGQLAIAATPLVWGLLGFSVAWLGTNWLCRDEA